MSRSSPKPTDIRCCPRWPSSGTNSTWPIFREQNFSCKKSQKKIMEKSSYLILLAVFKTSAKAAIFQAAPGRIEPLAPPAKLRNGVFPQMVGNPPKKQPKMDHHFSRESPMGWLGYHPPFLGNPQKKQSL